MDIINGTLSPESIDKTSATLLVANKVLVILAKGLEMYENLWVVMC